MPGLSDALTQSDSASQGILASRGHGFYGGSRSHTLSFPISWTFLAIDTALKESTHFYSVKLNGWF